MVTIEQYKHATFNALVELLNDNEITDEEKIQEYLYTGIESHDTVEGIRAGIKQVLEELGLKKGVEEEFFNNVEEKVTEEKNKGVVKAVYTSGMLNDNIFFHTIFIQESRKYVPIVVTSEGDIIKVKSNYEELRIKGKKRNEILEDDKYYYFEHDNITYKYIVEDLFFKDTYRINTVSNEVLEYVEYKVSSKTVYEKVRAKIKEYYDHYSEYDYDIQVVNCIETYLLRVINKTFYQILQGKEDTGKSTLQKALSRLQFNGLFGGKGTVALNVRLMHYLGCNVNQDEFEKMGKDEKAIFIGVANTGLYGDGTYSIIDTSKKSLKDQITILNTYSKKIFSTNSLSIFDNSFLSRCYVLITTRQGRTLRDINDLSESEIREFQKLRNEQFVYCLFNWNDIKESIKLVKSELEKEGVFGRTTDMNSIILGIIRHFKGDYYLKVKDHLKEKEGIKQEEKSNTNESLVFECIVNKCLSETESVELTNKEIAEYVATERNLNEDESKNLSKSIGWIIKNYDLVRRKDHLKKGSKGARKYIIEKEILIDMLKRFQFSNLLKKFDTETTLRNGRNGRNGFAPTVSEVSEVSEGNFLKQQKQPLVPVETVQTELDTDIVNLKCHICGESPSHLYDSSSQGKPICKSCFKAKEVNREP